MQNSEIFETTDMLEDIVKDTKDALSPLKEEIEYRGLENKFQEMYLKTERLDAEYKDLLWQSPRLIRPQHTNTVVDWSVFLVHDEERGSTYGLQLYWSYLLSNNEIKDPWRLPELIIWDSEWARKTYKLDARQYKDVQEKIDDVLKREEEQVRELRRKNGMTEVDEVIDNL